MRRMKAAGGPLTKDAQRFLQIHQTYNGTVTAPFNSSMGGIQATCFWNSYPDFQDTNNLSLAIFIEYGSFKILFPGDLEKDGWDALLSQPNFVRMLPGTDVLVASHHGRQNGFNSQVFKYFTPSVVVISDKPIAHDTQRMVPDYRAVVRTQGVKVATTMKNRHVLTTRRDGSITFLVDEKNYRIETEHMG
jgi:beta-lactamase superfamily II metal-dependent hydrolase